MFILLEKHLLFLLALIIESLWTLICFHDKDKSGMH